MRAGLAIVTVLVAGCMRHAPPAPFPAGSGPITILPVRNRTADPLDVAGTSMIERAFRSTRVTVADLIDDEARAVLRARGYRVTTTPRGRATHVDAAPSAVPENARRDPLVASSIAPEDVEAAARVAAGAPSGGLMLYFEVRRWEPDAPTHPEFVIVGVGASLFETGTGRIVWSARPAVHPITTPGSVFRGAAYATAARKVVDELLGSAP